jgi:hypothetical protein
MRDLARQTSQVQQSTDMAQTHEAHRQAEYERGPSMGLGM